MSYIFIYMYVSYTYVYMYIRLHAVFLAQLTTWKLNKDARRRTGLFFINHLLRRQRREQRSLKWSRKCVGSVATAGQLRVQVESRSWIWSQQDGCDCRYSFNCSSSSSRSSRRSGSRQRNSVPRNKSPPSGPVLPPPPTHTHTHIMLLSNLFLKGARSHLACCQALSHTCPHTRIGFSKRVSKVRGCT